MAERPEPHGLSITLDDWLREARKRGLARLDARVLAAHVLGQPSSWVHAHGDHPLTAAQSLALQTAAARRLQGEPVAYITGEREFWGLRLRVNAAVLDPRPDTETLVEWALALLPDTTNSEHPPRILDLGTGSGAIALALCRQRPDSQVFASDNSPEALTVARSNGDRLGLTVHWRHGRWLDAWPGQTFDLIVSNPPYLAADDPHLAALQAEPQGALVSGPDGLADLRVLAATAPRHLAPGGWLLLEHGHDQGPAVAALLRDAGLTDIGHRTDLAGHTRCTGGRRAAS